MHLCVHFFRLEVVLIPYGCFEKLSQSWWLKNTHICSYCAKIKVLARLHFLQGAVGETWFSCLFHLLQATTFLTNPSSIFKASNTASLTVSLVITLGSPQLDLS